MITNYTKIVVLSFMLTCAVFSSFAQTQTDGRKGTNVINTAIPFLLIGPDARSGGMGEVGVALAPDINSTHWNPAKLAFLKEEKGFSLSYSPWLKELVPDINLGYLAGYYKLDERNTIGGSFRYFSLGDIQLLDDNANQISTYSPNEFAIDGSFARTFGENFSLGSALRFSYSNLNAPITDATASQNNPGTSVSADISGFYQKDRQLFGKDATLAFGANISNIGTKLSYTESGQKFFIPTNMRLGGASTFHLDPTNDFTFALDINKLLVPTPNPEFGSDGRFIRDASLDKSVPAGIFGSFGDAPGGFSEELQEISISTGVEYNYNQQFALRAGYFYENPNKGNRKYLTLGLGLKYNVVNLNFSYVVANQNVTPLANTLRFSLLFNFAGAAPTVAK